MIELFSLNRFNKTRPRSEDQTHPSKSENPAEPLQQLLRSWGQFGGHTEREPITGSMVGPPAGSRRRAGDCVAHRRSFSVIQRLGTGFELPTVKFEFNKRNFIVRSLFQYVWLCIGLYRFSLVWSCCDFKDFYWGLLYDFSVMCILFIYTAVNMCDWHVGYIINFYLLKNSANIPVICREIETRRFAGSRQ